VRANKLLQVSGDSPVRKLMMAPRGGARRFLSIRDEIPA
jgi:hypothetical protein